MTTWSPDERDAVGRANELRIATRRVDGRLRPSVIVLVIRHGADLYVRSVNGRGSAWFPGVADRHAGHISAGGVDRDVTFLARRGRGHAVGHVTSPPARTATVRLLPS